MSAYLHSYICCVFVCSLPSATIRGNHQQTLVMCGLEVCVRRLRRKWQQACSRVTLCSPIVARSRAWSLWGLHCCNSLHLVLKLLHKQSIQHPGWLLDTALNCLQQCTPSPIVNLSPTIPILSGNRLARKGILQCIFWKNVKLQSTISLRSPPPNIISNYITFYFGLYSFFRA